MSLQRDLRVGILGAARVATYAMIDAAKEVDGITVQAVAARDPERAQAYAETHSIPKVYADYQALIDAPDVDAVYNALPPNLHAFWSIRAVEAGKPVLCEKPFALTIKDVEAMLEAEARTGRLIMEAQHSHYHPLAARMRDIVQSGQLGTIEALTARFNAPIPCNPNDLRFIGDVGGGALWDLGVYPAYWIRSAMGEQPLVLSAHQWINDQGADLKTEARLLFPSGALASLETDMNAPLDVMLHIEGSKGALSITNPVAPHKGHKFALTLHGKTTYEEFTNRPTYAFQLEAFRDALRDSLPVPTRGEDSLDTIRLLDAIRATATQE